MATLGWSQTQMPTVNGVNLCADSSGNGTGTQTCNTTPSFTPVAGSCITYTTTTANTGTSLSLNVNGLGARSIVKWQSQTVLTANDILANMQVLTCYDGTNWELSTIGNSPAGAGTVTSFSAGNAAPIFTTSVATQTSTTPDVRGTFTSATAADGTLRVQMFQGVDPFIASNITAADQSAFFGATQFSSV